MVCGLVRPIQEGGEEIERLKEKWIDDFFQEEK